MDGDLALTIALVKRRFRRPAVAVRCEKTGEVIYLWKGDNLQVFEKSTGEIEWIGSER